MQKIKTKIGRKLQREFQHVLVECHNMILYQIYSTFILHHQFMLLIRLNINAAS
jgi:hypothetical protein